MNPFILSFVALCLTQGAIAQYQGGASYSGQQGGYQRKMSPSPQSYNGAQSAGGYQAPAMMHQQSYGEQQSNSYGAEQYAQRAPSSAAVSSYDERTPAASSGYGKAAAPSYNRQSSYQQQHQAAPAYGGHQQQQSYAKAAPKYEEPSYPPMPFAWGYDINDGYGGAQYHKESGDEYGKRTGSYGYTDAYGIYRQVDYVADEYGFRATIKTNEPGTSNESPADVELHAYEPPSNYYAGNSNNYNSGSYNSGKQSASSYSAAPAQSYSARPMASYGQQRPSYKAAAAAAAAPVASYSRPSSYEPAAQYASSAIVPVYQKLGAAVAAPTVAAPVASKKY